MEGAYRLKLTLFEVVGHSAQQCASIYTKLFYVFTAKKVPGMEESTSLSCVLADQGIKIRIRKELRTRKKSGATAGDVDADGEDADREVKERDSPAVATASANLGNAKRKKVRTSLPTGPTFSVNTPTSVLPAGGNAPTTTTTATTTASMNNPLNAPPSVAFTHPPHLHSQTGYANKDNVKERDRECERERDGAKERKEGDGKRSPKFQASQGVRIRRS
jgi:hypothetical protein